MAWGPCVCYLQMTSQCPHGSSILNCSLASLLPGPELPSSDWSLREGPRDLGDPNPGGAVTVGNSENGPPPPPSTEKHNPLGEEHPSGAKGHPLAADLEAKKPRRHSLSESREKGQDSVSERWSAIPAWGLMGKGGQGLPGARTIHGRALGPSDSGQGPAWEGREKARLHSTRTTVPLSCGLSGWRCHLPESHRGSLLQLRSKPLPSSIQQQWDAPKPPGGKERCT